MANEPITLTQVLGFVPAVIFPLASAVQLSIMVWKRSAQGVSVVTWSLFALANICLYLYMDKGWELQALATTLGTAAIQIVIVVLAVAWKREPVPASNSGARG